jgi:uncharacterized protein with NAD-binding domain and iron-sulfur cluster
MMRRSPSASPRKATGRASTNSSTSLIATELAPALKRALSKCQRLREELSTKQAQLRKFEELDHASFKRWLVVKHGRLLSQIRGLEEELREHAFILEILSKCAMACPERIRAVHAELLDHKKRGILFTFVLSIPKETNASSAEDSATQNSRSPQSDFEDCSSLPQKHEKAPKLKTCYRNLAKRLHPDHSTLEESLRAQRWHEIQTAYACDDLETLQHIEAVCDIDQTGLSTEVGLARLNDLAEYHRAHLRPIRRALKTAETHIAFRFHTYGPASLRYDMKQKLKQTISNLRTEIERLKQAADALLYSLK